MTALSPLEQSSSALEYYSASIHYMHVSRLNLLTQSLGVAIHHIFMHATPIFIVSGICDHWGAALM